MANQTKADKKLEHGHVIINTGEGKGKTTAALGLAVRAAGQDLRVLLMQFIKGAWRYGELKSLDHIPGITVERLGKGFTVEHLRRIPLEEHRRMLSDAWERVCTRVLSGDYDMAILDEINYVLRDDQLNDVITTDMVLDLLRNRPQDMHMVLTGRDAQPEIIDYADLVTEMTKIKHPYDQGYIAKKGIEY